MHEKKLKQTFTGDHKGYFHRIFKQKHLHTFGEGGKNL